MNKKAIIMILSVFLVLLFTTLSSAYLIRDVAKAKQAEWDSYQQYKTDYAEFYGLKGYEQYLSDYSLERNFGFYGPSHYYVPSNVLAAKYNPPLQGDVYCTDTRGCTTSLNQPSAVKYYGEQINGKYTGYIPSTLNGVYFDHPESNNAYGYLTVQPNYGYGAGIYNYGQNYYDYGINEQARFYARVADPLSNGFYIVGYY